MLVSPTSSEARRSGGGDGGNFRLNSADVGFRARSHGGARDHSHSNQEELRISLEWSHGSPAAGKLTGRRGIYFQLFLFGFRRP